MLPGTGGLTRVVDKRRVRRDLADVFATTAEGVARQAGRAVAAGRRGGAAAREWDETVAAPGRRAARARSEPPAGASGIALTPLHREVDRRRDRATGTSSRASTATRGLVDDHRAAARTAVRRRGRELHEQGAAFWPLAMTRELDDLILRLRTNEPELGTWVLRTEGDAGARRSPTTSPARRTATTGWPTRSSHYLKRTLKRLDVDQPQPGRADRAGQLLRRLAAGAGAGRRPPVQLDGVFEDDDPDAEPRRDHPSGRCNLGPLPMGNGLTRLQTRFLGRRRRARSRAEEAAGRDAATPPRPLELGLVTVRPGRHRLGGRGPASRSRSGPASARTRSPAWRPTYRFAGPETLETKIFGRLTAWQNWIFYRPNAAGPDGALRRYGTGQRADFDRKRV